MRDDIGKLPLPPAAKAYARRSGLASMMRQPRDFTRVNAMLTNPGKPNVVKNYTAGSSTDGKPVDSMKHAIKDSAQRIVYTMLDEADDLKAFFKKHNLQSGRPILIKPDPAHPGYVLIPTQRGYSNWLKLGEKPE